MKSLLALVVIVLTACAIAHSGNPRVRKIRNIRLPLTMTPRKIDLIRRESVNYRDPGYLSTYLMDRGRIPYLALKAPEFSLLNEAISDIGKLPEDTESLYKKESESGEYQLPVNKVHKFPSTMLHPRSRDITYPETIKLRPPYHRSLEPTGQEQDLLYKNKEKAKPKFAYTPMDEEYFAPTENSFSNQNTSEGPLRNTAQEKKRNEDASRDKYQILNRDKTLVVEDLEKLRQGVKTDNLESTAKPKKDDFLGYLSGDTAYMLAISAGVTTTIVFAVSLITYGCYLLMERAKSAAAVDYPAYGVTGPTVDISGDRRLAQSAQMYHYQHQKQQIIAMERNTIEQRDGSLSGPESEEENEEGDYTVYECPGFATTGDMEVKNPLFDEPTPATPGKVQVLQAQPKE